MEGKNGIGLFNKKTIAQFIKFGLVGALNTFLSYAIYSIGIWIGLHYLVSNIIAFIITVFISYILNNRFVFKAEDGGRWAWFIALVKVYLSYACTSLLLTSVLLWVQVTCLGISEMIAPFINLIFTVPLNFLMNKFWAYKDKS